MSTTSARLRVRRARRRGEVLVRTGLSAGAARAGRVPIPDAVRSLVLEPLVWEPVTRLVPVHRVLLGGQNGMRGAQWARATGDLMWTSRRVTDGPHAALLRAAAAGPLSDADVLASPYAAMARRSIAASGQYFGAVDDRGVLDVARAFLDPPGRTAGASSGAGGRVAARSLPGTPVLVAPVRDSDCFQVVDGHHRLARLAVAGRDEVEVRVRRRPVTTPLQDLLDRMSWIGGERELYQPVDAPELAASWSTVRRCTDRLERMRRELDRLGVHGTGYLDVASCYGWFVAAMADAGYDAHGVERDPLGAVVAEAAYGLAPGRIETGEAVAFLQPSREPYDVVSCFSLLHHFALGRGEVDAATLLRMLDRVTGRVLFVDTGQDHESWFRESLRGWDAEFVGDFLTRHGTFDRVVDLGPDLDGVPPYEGNYGRHLYACIRDA